ncbi:hypothetical protein ACIRYZ_44190 [Kitasatospora sp. NPDC101155]|uniref:hypothetical protein n=1 Tax=Kitasatospora sp. NPDC101155 TaxID=3364097 RepID=UPI0037F3F45C
MSSPYTRALRVGTVALALAENLELTTEQTEALAFALAAPRKAPDPGPKDKPSEADEDDLPGSDEAEPAEPGSQLTDQQLDAVVAGLVAEYGVASYRQMHRRFIADGHRAGAERLRAAWHRTGTGARRPPRSRTAPDSRSATP